MYCGSAGGWLCWVNAHANEAEEGETDTGTPRVASALVDAENREILLAIFPGAVARGAIAKALRWLADAWPNEGAQTQQQGQWSRDKSGQHYNPDFTKRPLHSASRRADHRVHCAGPVARHWTGPQGHTVCSASAAFGPNCGNRAFELESAIPLRGFLALAQRRV